MKLAEALMLRADMQKKLASLRERITQNAVVQEGDTPAEDPAKLMKEAVGVLDELERLVTRINSANQASKLPDGRTLMQAIARRDALVQQHALICAAIAGTKREPDRYSMREIKWVATVDVPKLQKQADDLAKKVRELNALIQETNWTVELG
ncbi:MAG: septicolysin [Planctomycetes bacterium]|nr:septicolysin [Planctomycetota bacterium]